MEKDWVISFGGLARFGRAIWRHLWLILGVTLLAGVVVVVLNALAAPAYQAESWVLMRTAGTGAQQVNPVGGDVTAIGVALGSRAVEALVLADPDAAALPEADRQPGVLNTHVDVAMDSRPDLTSHIIVINATEPTAEDAVLLANLWAKHSVEFLNQYYVGNTASLQQLQAAAKAKYDQAEQAYEDFLTTSSVPELQAQADALDRALGDFLDVAHAGQTGAYLEQLKSHQRDLAAQYALQEKLQLAVSNAQALKTAITGSAAPDFGNSIALAGLLATSSSLVPTGTLPVQIQVTAPLTGTTAPDRAQQLQQVDTLLTLLQTQAQGVQTHIADLSQALQTTQPYTSTATTPPGLDALIAQDRDANKALAHADAIKQQMQAQRDAYLSTYTDLSKRLADVTSGLSSLNQANQIVQATTQLSERSQGVGRALVNTLVAALGLMILLVLVYELIAPGRQIARELFRRGRATQRPAPSAQ